MEIEETIFSKGAVINTQDPFAMSMAVLEKALSLGEVVEKKNIFETDGPLKRAVMEFDVIRRYDDYSQFRISLMMTAEANMRSVLEIDMVGVVKTKMEDEGFFSSVFAEFYLENLYHKTISRARDDVERAGKYLEKNIEAMAK